jgi:SAM-dependent methyltransferase
MIFQGIEISCPRCRGELERVSEDLIRCSGCACESPVILGIPDLRVFPDPYIGIEEDRAKARRLAEKFNGLDFEGFVHYYYSQTAVVPAHHARLYTRGLLAASARAADWLQAWESASDQEAKAGALLDVGCGTAPILVAAAGYPQRVGVDIALRWLIVGKKRLAEAGVECPLICACAEALPFADASFDRAVADSALEHLRDQPQALAELHRVLRPQGRLFVATPNRFSLGPDPQTGVWGGGMLAKGWTAAIVRRQGGIPPVRRLLSIFSLRRLLRGAGFSQLQIFLPRVPPKLRAQFSPLMNFLMSVYDLVLRFPPTRYMLYLIGPLLHAVAVREDAPNSGRTTRSRLPASD